MACVTLKRSLEQDAPSAVSNKRRRFHHHHCGVGGGSRSPPSQQMAAMAAAAAVNCLTFVPPPPPAADAAQGEFPATRLPPELLSQRLAAEVKRMQRRRQLAQPQPHQSRAKSDAEMSPHSSSSSPSSSVVVGKVGNFGAGGPEPALFTLSQVQAIAEKLLAEREQQLRGEFQALLSAKLQEQYDAFLRFNHDQLYRMHSGAPMSYVS